MKLFICSLFFCLLALGPSVFASQVDCSEAYNGQPAECIRVTCDEKYQAFIGTWKGPFSAYARELSKTEKTGFRPYENTVTYDEKDCLKNVSSGEVFIIGRRTDVYPAFAGLSAKTEHGLLITGKLADGSPFLRTVDENGLSDYHLEFQNKPANLSIWSLTVPASEDSPEMKFVTIDGQDFSETSDHKRNVTVTMTVGPAQQPYWEGVVVSGFHTLQK